ncbi:uncharacterized protein MAM_04642 [Metarhizium album ARSEF 1941]|uniref:Transcription factor, fungi n=1 Tax=Metarhizium album (strain ARSEF 1941) TaxID=1081103 RepID=A0A0B2WVZ3_METAS|nr:uncharacterized protein MAM_04642 [Metarhizium album ARSEF 1941]KHN97627.1 Transcription factor, fungi [Metarhizium album ARSEF 1941]
MPQPLAIAPAPGKSPSMEVGIASTPDSEAMHFNCQSCVRKKVKCNRALPVCSRCHKGKLECTYLAPPPRKRRRKHDEDPSQRLARYESILRAHGLLQAASVSSSPSEDVPAQRSNHGVTEVLSNKQGPAEVGKLVSADGRSRYIDSVLLLPAGDGDLCELSDSDSEADQDHAKTPTRDQSASGSLGFLAGEAIPLAMFGHHQSLAAIHPTRDEALTLWNVYVQNVESLCKILHTPTVGQMVDAISRKPDSVSKGDECLIFGIYYLAVFSLPDADCLQTFHAPKHDLITKYRGAVLQALVNASWLKTTSLRVLQAYVMFLVAARSQVDPHTFWSLTGIAIRLAQRMGLHRDGENLGLPPFEVQIRRRLFWQLLPLDTYAGQVSGTGISIAPDSWDTKQPLNINDDQIYPGMSERPEEKNGATEMIFSLARIELSSFYAKTGVKLKGAAVSFRNSEDFEKLINDVEGSIEIKYLRYCDILNPLHLLTLGVVRSAANIVRLRNRMTPVMDKTVTDLERTELCALSERILETDSTIYRNPSLKKFQWQVKNFFLWDALLCILLSITKSGFYKGAELDKMWNLVGEVFANHGDLLERKRVLHSMICEVTLKAWQANPPRQHGPEPSFISSLQSQPKRKLRTQQDAAGETASEVDSSHDAIEDASTLDGLFGNIDGTNLMMESSLKSNSSDWLFWDQFYRDTNLC